MNTQLKPLSGHKIITCPYCSDDATKQVRIGIGRIGFYFPCCSRASCIGMARIDAKARYLAHQESIRQATLTALDQNGETIRHRLISTLGITLGWNGKYQYGSARRKTTS